MRFVSIASALILSSVASVALAQSPQDFTLVNRTGYTIDQVYVSPVKASDWQEDVLGQDQLENGQRVNITFPKRARTCNWDLKVVYDDNETAEWSGFNLCEVSRVTIKYNRRTGETSAEYE